MRADETVEECVDRLLRAFRTYDRAVDVVSAFEMVFTESNSEVPSTVDHFERFPSIPVGSGTRTPDFTTVFEDGTGLVGEVARIARVEESVDGLCDQILAYDQLQQLSGSGGLVDVNQIDVVLLVPLDIGPAAAIQILERRLLNPDHPYKPASPPCIVQFGFDEGRYLFQRIQHSLNGLPRDNARPDGLGRWFGENGDFRAKPERFAHIKAARAFVNDGIEELYLAVHLWAKTFATQAGSTSDERPVVLTVNPEQAANDLRQTHGRVRADDIRRALALLEHAKLAEPDGTGSWRVGWEELHGKESDLARLLAERICTPPRSGPLARVRRREAAARVADTTDNRPRLF